MLSKGGGQDELFKTLQGHQQLLEAGFAALVDMRNRLSGSELAGQWSGKVMVLHLEATEFKATLRRTHSPLRSRHDVKALLTVQHEQQAAEQHGVDRNIQQVRTRRAIRAQFVRNSCAIR